MWHINDAYEGTHALFTIQCDSHCRLHWWFLQANSEIIQKDKYELEKQKVALASEREALSIEKKNALSNNGNQHVSNNANAAVNSRYGDITKLTDVEASKAKQAADVNSKPTSNAQPVNPLDKESEFLCCYNISIDTFYALKVPEAERKSISGESIEQLLHISNQRSDIKDQFEWAQDKAQKMNGAGYTPYDDKSKTVTFPPAPAVNADKEDSAAIVNSRVTSIVLLCLSCRKYPTRTHCACRCSLKVEECRQLSAK